MTPALSLHQNSKLCFFLSGMFFLHTQQQASIAPWEGTRNTYYLVRAFNHLHVVVWVEEFSHR